MLNNVDKIYIPLKYFSNPAYEKIITDISNKFNLYIYLPTIIRKNYIETTKNILSKSINKFKISGFVLSNLCHLTILRNLNLLNKNFDIIGNYTLNVFNNLTKQKLQELDLNTITISPELNKSGMLELCYSLNDELIVYGNLPVMTSNYCLLGCANKCYSNCSKKCSNKESKKYYLKDRLGFKFRLIPDNSQTITTIYNSKTTSISPTDFNASSYRIDILDENINEINDIINTVKSGNRLEGKDFTNSNLNREI